MPSVLVGHAPGLETLAIGVLEAGLEECTVSCRLLSAEFIGPFNAIAVVVPPALDVDLGEVDQNANVQIPLDVRLDIGDPRIEVDVLVKLEPNAVDTAIAVLQILNKVVNSVCFDLPVALAGRVVVVVVEEQGSGIGFACPLERLADEIVDLVPNTVSDEADTVPRCDVHGFIDDVPGDALAGIPTDSRLNVVLQEILDLCCISRTADEVGSVVTTAHIGPHGRMATPMLPILLGQFKGFITL